MFLNEINLSYVRLMVFCIISVALCGSKVTDAPNTEMLTTGLEDLFYDGQRETLSIKNISFETKDNDEYYLNWFFDNGNNVDIESSINIDIYLKKNGPGVFFRHIRKITKSQFFKINIGKLEKCSSYNVTLQAYNKLGETEKYLYNIETSPLSIENILENVTNNKTGITWTSPCSNFKVMIENRRGLVEEFYLTNNTNRLDVNQALYCTSYSITTLSAKGSQIGTRINRRIVPGLVEDFKLTPSTTSILVTWSPPTDRSCVTGYKIQRGDDNFEDLPAEATSYNYTGLNSCQMYNIGVASLAEQEIGLYQMETSETQAPSDRLSKVVDLTFIKSDSMTINWSVLPQEEHCIKQFSVTINNDLSFNQLQTVFVIENPIACQIYTVSVVAIGIDDTIENSEPNIQEYTAQEIAPNPPNISVNAESGLEMNSITFVVVIEPIPESVCQLKSVEITCNAKTDENDPDLPWVNIPVTKDFPISAEETEFQLTFTELIPYTNYTCYGISKTENLSSANSAEVNATTKLFEVENLFTSNLQSDSFKIEWTVRMENRTVPEVSFLINISDIGPMHYIPVDCKLVVNDIVNITSETNFEANDLLPNHNYTISVHIISWLGISEPSEITEQTLTAASEAVRYLEYKINIASVDDYNVTADVFWKYPCNTNGKLTAFKIVIVETNKETGNEKTFEDYVEIYEPEPKVDYTYEMKLNPYSNYTVTVSANSNPAGIEETINFDSPDGIAEAPETEVTNITASGFNVEWKSPVANGALLKYQIEINDLGPKFDVPLECEGLRGPDIKADVNKSLTEFNYTGAFAYHEYKIKLKAITDIGDGKTSTLTKNTSSSDPGPIRNLTVEYVQSHSSGEFEADMYTVFLPSCNLAGVFLRYEIEIFGKRSGFEDHKANYTIENINGNDTKLTPLRPGYDYTVTGRVKNNEAISKDVSYQFNAPSGVPGLSNITNITAPDPTSSITFTRSSFTNDNGDILYFAVLLSANYEFDDEYAYWESWPSLGHYRKGPGLTIEPYQITEVKWQPKTDVISIQLGNENCQDQMVICNGELREDTKYTVTIRAFTENAYRDIRIHFNMPSLIRSISLGVILGVTFGILFTGFIFIGSYLVYRRGMFRSAKLYKNGRHSATNPHSKKADVCIVLPPAAYKKDDDENAESFAMLQKMSERNKGVTFVATEDDNRKKNRYINILPFDSTRVILSDGTDSDYINASFVKGYSHQIEYIATQGPLESTVEDFWRMVAQERVTTILMLTQLKEQQREKCFKYFPYNLENMRFSDMSLYCSEEDVCKSYIQRKIVLDIGTDAFNIQHFQYTDWPDFNVPNGTETMIKFVKKIRKIKNQIGGVILVHCSAGVGRTGTLISIDMLIQAIDDGQEYNIYQTVLDLRSQRVNMVQNEKQYLYIGSCVEDYVKNRRKSAVSIGLEEPVYANVISR